ncbi:MAG: hypothetical protein GXY83_44545 [Rhodopirellula sp.]|nr:hypothetical protein [Rhodopirellula sp.]
MEFLELNPVRAGLVARPCDWRWSSAWARLAGRDEQPGQSCPLAGYISQRTMRRQGIGSS